MTAIEFGVKKRSTVIGSKRYIIFKNFCEGGEEEVLAELEELGVEAIISRLHPNSILVFNSFVNYMMALKYFDPESHDREVRNITRGKE